MAQIFLGEKAESATRDEEVEAKQGSLPSFKYSTERTYLIIADTAAENEPDILANPSIPALGSTAVLGDPVRSRGAKLVSRIARHPVTGVVTALWEVIVSSDSKLSFSLAGVPGYVGRDPIVKWETEEEEVSFDYDMQLEIAAGIPYPVINAVGEPIFDTRKIYYPVATITRYESYPFDPTINFDYANTLNQLTFWGAAPQTALMCPVEVEEEIDEENSLIYSKVTYRIKFKVGDYYTTNPWRTRYLNEGYYYRPNAGDEPIINKVQGNATKINLNLDGTVVEPGNPPTYVVYDKYKVADWTPLGLNLPDDDPTD